MAYQHAIPTVWGVPNQIKELRGVIPGKRRFRFRNNRSGRVFIKGKHHFVHYILIDQGTHWEGLVQGQNSHE